MKKPTSEQRAREAYEKLCIMNKPWGKRYSWESYKTGYLTALNANTVEERRWVEGKGFVSKEEE